MKADEFFDAVAADPDLSWGGVLDGKVRVANKRNGMATILEPRAILDGEWKDLRGVMLQERQARIMEGLSRIVGYWSLTRNWNRSKLAELRDRAKGNYGVPAKVKLGEKPLPKMPVCRVT